MMLPESFETRWLWWFIQSTLIASVSLALLAFSARIAPAVRVRLALFTLVGMTSLPWLSMLPSWSMLQPMAGSIAASTETRDDASQRHPVVPAVSNRFDIVNALVSTADQVHAAVQSATIEQPTSQFRFPTAKILSLVAAGLVLFGLARLIYGSWEVRRILKATELCHDPRLLRLIDSVSHEFLRKPFDFRISSSIDSMALVGIAKTSLLLPRDWNSWSDVELRTALTHEFAHVQRRDPLLNLIAQGLLVLHFYHPLAHALVRRMRMDQELAADSLAAPHVGGQQNYLCSLAGLALRRTQAPMSWATLAFLPSRRSFVRRLEMFRQLKLQHGRIHTAAVLAASCGLLALMLGIAAWRPANAQNTTPGSPGGPKPAQSAAAIPDMLQYASANADSTLIAVDVPKLLSSPALATLVKQMAELNDLTRITGQSIELENYERIVIAIPTFSSDRETFALVRLKQAMNIETLPERGVIQLDERTFVSKMSKDAEELKSFAARLKANSQVDARSAALLQRHAGDTIQIAVPVAALSATMKLPAATAAFSPIWTETQTASIGIQLEQNVALKAILDTSDAKRVVSTLEAARTLALNAMEGLREQFGDAPENSVSNNLQLQTLANLFENSVAPALRSASLEPTDSQVVLKMEMDQSVPVLLGLLMPAIQSARQAAMRAQSANNLRQLGIALHVYHDAHGHLPPSVIVENGVERSWRVELLPYLEQNDLYQKYRKDRSWDSPENQAVLNAMPPVFKSMSRPADNMTPLRAIGNETGLLPASGQGVKWTDVTDGTSSTIAVVETAEMVPWTKPDQFTPSTDDLRKPGVYPGGFHALMADGSVKFMSETVDERVLKAFLTIAGREQMFDQ